MKPVSFLYKQRRTVVFVLATLALHGLVFDWAGGRLRAPAPSIHDDEVVLTAQLQAPAALPAPLAQPRAPVPRPRPLPARAAPDAPAEEASGAPTGDDAAPAAPAPIEAAAAPVPAPPEPAPPPAPVPAQASYTVELPPPAELDLDVVRTQPTGNPAYGVGHISWQTGEGHYSLRVEAGLNLLITTLNLLEIRSEGVVGAGGIEPASTLEMRRGRSRTATHFQRGETPVISFSAVPTSLPLLPGAQDRATVMMQLAGIGRANAAQLSDNRAFEMQVAEDRDAAVFGFYALGFEEIDTRLGTLRAWHVRRPPRAGAYSSALDLWFAPSLGWYPVQIRNTEANGAVTTQTVTKISAATAVSKKE